MYLDTTKKPNSFQEVQKHTQHIHTNICIYISNVPRDGEAEMG